MNVLQGIRMAWKSILGKKARSFLTMLGIIIGVSAVIALVAIGQGATSRVRSQVEGLGTNLLTVNITGRGNDVSLSLDESMAYTKNNAIESVSPVTSGRATLKYGTTNESVSVEGITAEYEDVRDYHVQEGRFVLPIDVEFRQKVALIGSETAANFFGTKDPVGENIVVNGIRYKIVGLLASRGSSSGGSNDDKLLIPISSAERLLKTKGVRTLYVQVKTPEQVEMVMNELKADLYKKFDENENSYTVFNQQDMLETVSSITDTMTLALGGIAGISLLVGGIGIMNIMLVSVSERTREIGIRKAIGAKRRDILLQFLMESMVLGAIGGLLGIGTGTGGAVLAGHLMKMTVEFSFNIMLLAFAFSVAIGIIFGLFPANKAARMKPVEALRFD